MLHVRGFSSYVSSKGKIFRLYDLSGGEINHTTRKSEMEKNELLYDTII